MEGNTPMEGGEPNDNVPDLRVARWRKDPFMREMLELTERVSKCADKDKEQALTLIVAIVRIAEKRSWERAKTKP